MSKNIEYKFILLTPNLKNVGLAKLMGDVTTELQNLSLETMSFGEDEEKKGKDRFLMNDLSNFMEALDKLKKGEFVNFKQVFMIKSLSSNLISKKIEVVKVVPIVFGDFCFKTFNSFEDATKTASIFGLLGQEVKLDEEELDVFSCMLNYNDHKCYVLITIMLSLN
ncbi:unnamed protein product [Arabidopsis arenosa]|uniref:Uncharacterized protein n=1 Tax=Arabidopsis arenosa TaxID=38785 RepID=A0A8S2A476_ARAAE|nr:unnamed protein product [Arabidopsis arenosa]